MPVLVVPYDPSWAAVFQTIAAELVAALGSLPATIEHVGSTSVPGLAAKPVIDIDVIVTRENVAAAITALESIGYTHQGNLGLPDRESMRQPAPLPSAEIRRNVYVCVEGTLHLRNHLAVRDTLRRDEALRDAYAGVKLDLSTDPDMDIERYLAGKTPVLQRVLDKSDLTDAEKEAIRDLNAPHLARFDITTT